MGVYYYTFLYKGEIVDNDEEPEKYKKECAEGGNLFKDSKLYCDNFVTLASLDPIIEKHEIERGYVSLKEVLALVEKNPKLKGKWGVVEDNSDIFICQGSWWTLEPSDHSLKMEYNLPCYDLFDENPSNKWLRP
jgi:hypothetical protein